MADGSFGDLDLGQTIRGFVTGQKLFGRYSLVRILGRGGMGVVWLARDEELGREVALKFLPELLLHDLSALRGLKRETTRSLSLTHPHIVRIYDFINDGRAACISMEYVDGETLANLRSEKQNDVFEPAEIGDWVRELCDALDYAHRKVQIVHRDLKPANLMVNSKGDLKIADFGVARSLTESVSMVTMWHGTSGTLVYMSPQQLDGEPHSHLDDIYSVGATLYELLTSKPPFYSGQIDRQIREKLPVSPSNRRAEFRIQNAQTIPREWEQTITACLAKNPLHRPQSAAEIAHALGLRSIGFTSTAAVATPSALESTQKQRAKAPKLAIVGSAALILAVVGYYSWSQRSTSEPQQRATVVTTPAREPEKATPAAAPAPSSPGAAVLATAERLLKEATELRDRGDTTNALARLQDAAQSDPKNANVLAQMAMIYESIQLPERSNETWRKIQEIGPSAGALYELADMKLKSGVTAPATTATGSGLADVSPLDAGTTRNDANGIPDGSTFGITEVIVTDTPDADSETNKKLKIAVKARPNTPIDHTKVKIQVFFYDTLDGKEVTLTDADVSYEWLTPHHDWKATNPEVLAVTYLQPKKKTSANLPGPIRLRQYLGYIVRIYYNDQLQAVRADPTKLLNLFPPPFTAPR